MTAIGQVVVNVMKGGLFPNFVITEDMIEFFLSI